MTKSNRHIDGQRFQELVDAYGADTLRWPKAERLLAQSWCAQHSDKAAQILKAAKELDQILDAVRRPETDASFLHARILKTASSTPQDINAETLSSIATQKPAILATWKSIAATLIMTTGIGFGIGQVAAADTAYASAEALLSISLQSDYDEFDLNGDGL